MQILKANVDRLKQELLFVKKSTQNEIELMRKHMMGTIEKIIFKSKEIGLNMNQMMKQQVEDKNNQVMITKETISKETREEA